MYRLKYSSRFKRDLKRYAYNRDVQRELLVALNILMGGKGLPEKYLNYQLRGEFLDCFECHLRPDLLLIYKIKDGELLILLLRIGSHSQLF